MRTNVSFSIRWYSCRFFLRRMLQEEVYSTAPRFFGLRPSKFLAYLLKACSELINWTELNSGSRTGVLVPWTHSHCNWLTFNVTRRLTNAGTSAGFRLRGSIPPCRLRRRKLWKFDYEMVHSEVHVYLNKYVVSIAPFSTPACPDWSQNIKLTEKTALFCMFFAFWFFIHFSRGFSWPHLPLCANAHEQTYM